MKLISANVENFRIHQSVVVNFHDNPILIGGPNETGKSTLIEAIHRAFFLRHNAGGAVQTGMVSTTHGGVPAVEVTFEAGGITYRLAKSFNGPRGSVTLAPEQGRSLAGDEAEEALARILSTGGAISGGGAQGKLALQWAHLWIWQGYSGIDPTDQVANVRGDLIQRLQESGGAVAQQSPLDAEVAATIADAYSNSHTKSGAARAGSPLETASRKVEAARAEVEVARERMASSRADADKVLRSREAIERHTAALTEIRQQVQEVETRRRELEKLEGAVEGAERDLKLARDDWERRRRTEADFAERRALLAKLEAQVAPAARAMSEGKEAHASALKDLKAARADLEKANESIEAARLRRDLAEACRRQVRSREQLKGKASVLEAIQKTREALADLQRKRARLPEVASRDVKQLHKLEHAFTRAQTTLEAIATDVELLQGEDAVTLGGKALATGERRSIDEPAELVLGKDVVIRISPGGGKDLEAARKALSDAEASLKKSLQDLGLNSVEAAAEALTRRETLAADIRAEEKRLEALDPSGTEQARQELSLEFDTASGRVGTLQEKVPDLELPSEPDAAADLLARCEDHLATVEEAIGNKRAAVTAKQNRADRQEAVLEEATEAHRKIASARSGTESGLAVLVEQYGEDKERSSALKAAEANRERLSQVLADLKTQRDALKPDQLEADHKRLTRSLETTANALQEARDELAGAEARLHSDGLEDPAELLAIAEAHLQSAREVHAREERISGALSLLNETFRQEQQTLSEQFSKPLADRINTYLSALFGPTARARVTFEDNQFTSIELVREAHAGSFPFDTLSGGTREQVAAAVRLAIAELLAAGFDGTLPVVFDDAFAHSDPERIKDLQRMLDLAVRNGLQVIILTCTPADYTTLGAPLIELG